VTKIILFTLLIFFFSPTYAVEKIDVEHRIDLVERSLKFVEASQLNYKIEKDLLKETYSNNYERINLFVTILLGFIAVLGYLGIKDIGAVKDKYYQELAELKSIKAKFDIKANEFDTEKQKIEDELKAIIKENQDQNRKFKFIELKEKMSSLYKDKNLSMALEFATAALEINPDDQTCLTTKGRVLTQLNQLQESLACYKIVLDIDPRNTVHLLNYIECLYFLGRAKEADILVEENRSILEIEHDGCLKMFFEVISLFHDKDIDKLKFIAKSFVSFENLNQIFKFFKRWNLEEAHHFVHYQEDGEAKALLQHIMWYWEEKLTGKQLLERLSLPLPMETT
jgi:tetratricopeptide (TPR) repeat protein